MGMLRWEEVSIAFFVLWTRFLVRVWVIQKAVVEIILVQEVKLQYPLTLLAKFVRIIHLVMFMVHGMWLVVEAIGVEMERIVNEVRGNKNNKKI